MVWVQSCQASQIPTASCALLYLIAAVTRYCHCLFILPFLTGVWVPQRTRLCLIHLCILRT